MAIKKEVNEQEFLALPEGIQQCYEKKGEVYVLDVEGFEDPAGLKRALESERKLKSDFEKEAKRWSSLGKTPDEVSELLSRLEEEEAKKSLKAGEFDKLKQQLLDNHAKELDKKDRSLKNMKQSLEEHLVDSAAVAAIAELKGAPVLLLPHVKASVKVIEDDAGRYNVQVIDSNGTPRINGKGEPFSIRDLVEEMRNSDVFGRAFEASGTSGSGSQGSKTQSGHMGKNPWKKDQWNMTTQSRIFKENRVLAERLAAEAGVKL